MEQQSPNERRLEDWMRTYGTAILRTCFVILSDAREAEDAMHRTPSSALGAPWTPSSSATARASKRG